MSRTPWLLLRHLRTAKTASLKCLIIEAEGEAASRVVIAAVGAEDVGTVAVVVVAAVLHEVVVTAVNAEVVSHSELRALR
jgi:hypothetical protein